MGEWRREEEGERERDAKRDAKRDAEREREMMFIGKSLSYSEFANYVGCV